MYNATDLLLFRVYILLGMRIGKYVLRIIVSNVRHIVLIEGEGVIYRPEIVTDQ
jgi:hypothetical protein